MGTVVTMCSLSAVNRHPLYCGPNSVGLWVNTTLVLLTWNPKAPFTPKAWHHIAHCIATCQKSNKFDFNATIHNMMRRVRCECSLSLTLVWFDALMTHSVWTGLKLQLLDAASEWHSVIGPTVPMWHLLTPQAMAPCIIANANNSSLFKAACMQAIRLHTVDFKWLQTVGWAGHCGCSAALSFTVM